MGEFFGSLVGEAGALGAALMLGPIVIAANIAALSEICGDVGPASARRPWRAALWAAPGVGLAAWVLRRAARRLRSRSARSRCSDRP